MVEATITPELVIIYYLILAFSFVIVSYIVTYRPAMRLVASALLDMINNDTVEHEPIRVFVSIKYRFITLFIYLVMVMIMFPFVAIATFYSNNSIIEGFSNGLLRSLLNIDE